MTSPIEPYRCLATQMGLQSNRDTAKPNPFLYLLVYVRTGVSFQRKISLRE